MSIHSLTTACTTAGRTNNAGDLVTKEGTQETAVTLLGLVLGVLCAQSIAASPHQAMALFLVLTAVHVWANYQAVFSLHADSVNPSRGFLLTQEILSLYQQSASTTSGVVSPAGRSHLEALITSSRKLSVSEVRYV
jgi:hypothetical protein